MKVREFVADSFAEAFARIRAEMGSDAYIISTRTVRAGRPWPWSRPAGPHQVVVTAAQPGRHAPVRLRPRPDRPLNSDKPLTFSGRSATAPPAATTASAAPVPPSAELRSELPAAGSVEVHPPSGRARAEQVRWIAAEASARTNAHPAWLRRLEQAEWQQELIAWIEKEWQRQFDQLDSADWAHCIRPWLIEELCTRLQVSEPWLALPPQALVIAGTGAAGSGAAQVGRRVTESYRQVAGWRTQVQTFDGPDEENPSWSPTEELRRQYDLIWLDLPAIDRLTTAQVQRWARRLANWQVDEVHWVMSAAHPDQAGAIWDRVSPLVPTHLTVTDVGRPTDDRFAYELAWRTGLRLRFLAARPAASDAESEVGEVEAVDDLEIVDSVQLVERIIRAVETDSPSQVGAARVALARPTEPVGVAGLPQEVEEA